jgi:hypothetical protein
MVVGRSPVAVELEGEVGLNGELLACAWRAACDIGLSVNIDPVRRLDRLPNEMPTWRNWQTR